MERERSGIPDERETAEPPEGQQNREREGPGSSDEPQDHPGARPAEDEDEQVDRDAEDTFPASDPPANY